MGRKSGLSLVPISSSPGRKLHRAHARMQQGLTQLFRNAGYEITTEAWVLLRHLWDRDRLTQCELGERVEKDRHNISRLVDALEEQGFVERRAARGDRRIREVALTRKGRAAQTPLMGIAAAFLKETFAGLSPEQIDSFLATLDHIISRLERSEVHVRRRASS